MGVKTMTKPGSILHIYIYIQIIYLQLYIYKPPCQQILGGWIHDGNPVPK